MDRSLEPANEPEPRGLAQDLGRAIMGLRTRLHSNSELYLELRDLLNEGDRQGARFERLGVGFPGYGLIRVAATGGETYAAIQSLARSRSFGTPGHSTRNPVALLARARVIEDITLGFWIDATSDFEELRAQRTGRARTRQPVARRLGNGNLWEVGQELFYFPFRGELSLEDNLTAFADFVRRAHLEGSQEPPLDLRWVDEPDGVAEAVSDVDEDDDSIAIRVTEDAGYAMAAAAGDEEGVPAVDGYADDYVPGSDAGATGGSSAGSQGEDDPPRLLHA